MVDAKKENSVGPVILLTPDQQVADQGYSLVLMTRYFSVRNMTCPQVFKFQSHSQSVTTHSSNYSHRYRTPVISNMNQSREDYPSSNLNLDLQHDDSILFILSTHESMVESTDLEDIPSSDIEFNNGITLMSTRDLEIRLSMLKLKMESMESTDLEPKDMELTEVVNV